MSQGTWKAVNVRALRHARFAKQHFKETTMTNKSIAISPFTMPAALAAADVLLGNPTWEANPNNPDQVRWLESFRRRAGVADELPEVRRHATLSSVDHATWLRAEGWDAQITQGSPDDVFLAATINIVAKWKEAGQAYKD